MLIKDKIISMNETQINKKTKFKLSLSMLLFKHMQNKKISESTLKLVELINISLFKYINQQKNAQKSTELKLVYINNLINEILFQNKSKKSYNLSAKTRKSNYNLTSIESFNKNKTNTELFDEINKSNVNDNNKYLKLKIHNRLKSEHDKYKIKELEYLQRIAELQSELNSYEANCKKLYSENNELIDYINNNNINIITKNKMNRNNSADNISINDPKNEKYFRILNYEEKNYNKNKKNNKLYQFKPLSNLSENNRVKNLKKELKQKYYKENYVNIADNYFSSNLNKNKNNSYRHQHFVTSLNDLNYKYQVGNGYLRNNFVKLKKEIIEKTNHLKKIKNLLNDIK